MLYVYNLGIIIIVGIRYYIILYINVYIVQINLLFIYMSDASYLYSSYKPLAKFNSRNEYVIKFDN